MTDEEAARMNYDLGHSRGFSTGVTTERERIRQLAIRFDATIPDRAGKIPFAELIYEPATTGGTT